MSRLCLESLQVLRVEMFHQGSSLISDKVLHPRFHRLQRPLMARASGTALIKALSLHQLSRLISNHLHHTVNRWTQEETLLQTQTAQIQVVLWCPVQAIAICLVQRAGHRKQVSNSLKNSKKTISLPCLTMSVPQRINQQCSPQERDILQLI